jgi:hypothetical protein
MGDLLLFLTTHPRPLSFCKEIYGTHLIFLKRGVICYTHLILLKRGVSDFPAETDNAKPFAFPYNSPPAPLFLQRDLWYAFDLSKERGD